MKLDIVIPCYNAESTLVRAVQSCLMQPELHTLRLIDDASTDQTWAIMQELAAQSDRIIIERLPENGGVARARNWGALQSDADFIAFLDADDAYEQGALAAAYFSLLNFSYLGLVRLKIKPVGLPERYALHEKIKHVWQILEMTGGGNTVFRRHFFLACGGFPCNGLFQQFGGEDGALGLATTYNSVVGTLFDDNEPGVLHYCHEGMHAERLLEAFLYDLHDPRITQAHKDEADGVTQKIGANLQNLKTILSVEQYGIMPLHVSRD